MNYKQYDPKEIESKWQHIWESENAFTASDDFDKPKYYVLVEFPYPSGQGLHVGHPRPYTGFDVVARKKRMDGFNVLYPMGWDAFGLPAENYAIKNKIHPKIVTQNNIKRFKKQLKNIGFSFDWSREINTTDAEYYKWTQWIFLKLFKHNLAYKAEISINFCTSCKVGLANEEVVNGVCERCGSPVIQKPKKQWMLRITNYAEKLLQGLESVDYTEKIKSQQINWIGRSEGAEVRFDVSSSNSKKIVVFTTRPDTIFGVSFIALSPESPILDDLKHLITNFDKVKIFCDQLIKTHSWDNNGLVKEKSGIQLEGVMGVNPVNNALIPIWVADYVLNYGTGAIMGVPGHDSRDWDFATKYNLPIIEVISGGNVYLEAYEQDCGTLINSSFLDNLTVEHATKKIIEWLEENNVGHRKINYKLRDWVFSRQRYWGEPIPLVYCENCGWVPLPEDQLPLLLPDVKNYVPSENGESPLINISDWVNTTCPKCNSPAKRETDTMPQWAGSSWYFLRYIDPHNSLKFADREKMNYWLPVDWYNGGNEHITLHLLYSRFWHKFLYDIGEVSTPEPYKKRTSHGMILGENNEKMSKSRGNVVNPDNIINEFGADTLRLYEMFMGTFEQSAAWSTEGVRGCRRFLDRVWKLQGILTNDCELSPQSERILHKTIKKVSSDYEKMKFNTAIAALMSFVNEFYANNRITREEMKILLLLLNPVAPHITEELFEILNFNGKIYKQSWPKYNESKIQENEILIPVQINGKLRKVISIPASSTKNLTDKAISEIALLDPTIAKQIEGKNIVKIVFVPDKIFNIVVK